MNPKTVVELDLVGYSPLARMIEENVGVEVVSRLNQQIQQFVDVGLAAVRVKREQVVLATAGDNAIVAFDKAGNAHRFATAVHKATEATTRSAPSLRPSGGSALGWPRVSLTSAQAGRGTRGRGHGDRQCGAPGSSGAARPNRG